MAIAKRCRKLNIPRPSRGYWAKIEAGQRPKRFPLPPASEQPLIKKVREFKDQSLMLPEEFAPLHALAAEFLKAAQSASLGYDKKRIHVRERPFPEADISKGIVPRAAQAFHVLLQVVEPLGIHFRRSQSSYDGGHFRKGNDRLHFKIEEKLVAKPAAAARKLLKSMRKRWKWPLSNAGMIWSRRPNGGGCISRSQASSQSASNAGLQRREGN